MGKTHFLVDGFNLYHSVKDLSEGELPRASARGFSEKFLPPKARTEPVNVKRGVIVPVHPETAERTLMHPVR